MKSSNYIPADISRSTEAELEEMTFLCLMAMQFAATAQNLIKSRRLHTKKKNTFTTEKPVNFYILLHDKIICP